MMKKKMNQPALICLLLATAWLLLAASSCQAVPVDQLTNVDSIVDHLREHESEPEETMELLRALIAKTSAGDKPASEADDLVNLASELLHLVSTSNESNCSLIYFNQLGRLSSRARDYHSISRIIDRTRSDQLHLCNQKNPRFSTYLAMNAAPHYLDF